MNYETKKDIKQMVRKAKEALKVIQSADITPASSLIQFNSTDELVRRNFYKIQIELEAFLVTWDLTSLKD